MNHGHNTWRSPCLSHLRRQPISRSDHGSLISFHLCLQMLIMCAGAFQVQGPHEPLVAILGGEAELPCFLLPPQNVKNMEIRWTRSLPSQVVHLYEDGRDKPEEAMKEYFKRTELMGNVMHKGIVVLRILNVQPSDNGQYHCAFFHNGSFYNDTVIELKVAALGSHPQFHVEVTKSRQLRLECKSEGWFPQPKVQWVDSEGREILDESETHTQDKSGLFHVTTSLLLRETSQKNLTCSIWNPVLNQKKEEQLSITVAESNSMTFSIMSKLAVLTLLVLLTSIGTWLCFKQLSQKPAQNQTQEIPGCPLPSHSTDQLSILDSQYINCPILDDRAASCPALSVEVTDTNTNCDACYTIASKQNSKMNECKGKGCHTLQW
ncbi:putative selection and upkeep of intraepithelial T-cells protein 1 homolog [Myotis yumanensis]|uniref:putative selection and upkeep of intraepithelial T-cells protein 1 homolog n=1 Tax=Myotis yumanensis TaxID=159337 RepID=UPI0038D3A1A2